MTHRIATARYTILLALLFLEGCNRPFSIPTNAPPRQFLEITSPHDGDIIDSLPVDVVLRATTLGGGAQSLLLEQSSALPAYNLNYGPFPLNPGASRQDLTVENTATNSDGENAFGLMTFTGYLTLSNGNRLASNSVTVCVTYFDRSISSPFPDLGYAVIDEYYCLPALFPELSTNEWARRIYIESALQIRGDRCLPRNSGGGLILQLFAQTTASYRVARVTADFRIYGNPALVRDYSAADLELDRVGLSGEFWALSLVLSVHDPTSAIPDGYTHIEVTVRAHDLDGVMQASDTTVLSLPACQPDMKEDALVEPTATATVPVIPTEEKKEPQLQSEDIPSDPPPPCPPTVYCGE
ncbi:MAG: hypothetical protein FJZ87_08195 [Chloroflexi bacterium]|nr:hypothetical protein [Chloroflexota bacterium]